MLKADAGEIESGETMKVERKCRIVEMDRLDAVTFWMVLEVGKLVEEDGLRGGQFLHIKCGDGQLLRRPISVAYAGWDEPEDLATLIFEVRGEGTEWLSRRKVGDELDVIGPLGNGFDVSQPGRYLLVGGGIGIPPLIQYGECLEQPRTAVLGFRTKDKAFPAITSRFQDHCEQTYICTDDGTLGRHGFVDAQVRDILEQDSGYTAILACGPKPMLRSVAKVAAQFGVPCQVSMEERMGCGVGACLVCATPMRDGTVKHVCKDGPVFNAEEVDWEDRKSVV